MSVESFLEEFNKKTSPGVTQVFRAFAGHVFIVGKTPKLNTVYFDFIGNINSFITLDTVDNVAQMLKDLADDNDVNVCLQILGGVDEQEKTVSIKEKFITNGFNDMGKSHDLVDDEKGSKDHGEHIVSESVSYDFKPDTY